MFRGHRAWFSQSVSPSPRELWAASGGTVTHWQDADYLFSSDAAHPDTRRIHESLDYLEGRATVFHSRYLSAGAKLSVVLGHFVLPPACLQEEIRQQIGNFIWEQAAGSLAEEPDKNMMDKPEAARTGCEEAVEEEDNALDLTESSKEETGSRAPAEKEEKEFLCHALQEYPVNNMVTGYPSAQDMKKYEGELRDFTPGASGYTVYWIHNEINIYSDTKSRAKKKL